MTLITVVGCGFVGSVFTTEWVKRCFAGKIEPRMRFIDDDKVDLRNCANQNFNQSDVGSWKVDVMTKLSNNNNLIADSVCTRLNQLNVNTLLEGSDVVIDGVDNLETRQVLWGWAQGAGKPVMHIGITEDGMGKVEWSHPQHNTFSLSPVHTVGKTIITPASGVTPPCELARMRATGLNVGFAAAASLAIYFGFDPEAYLQKETGHGWLTEWNAEPFGFSPQRLLWSQLHE